MGSSPEDVAAALRRYGLAPDVSAVALEADTLETVVFGLITREKKEGAA